MMATDSRTGKVAVLLAGRGNDDAVTSVAVAAAADCSGRLTIFSVPRRVPLGVHTASIGYTVPIDTLTLRAEALDDAMKTARRATGRVPPDIPADYAVVQRSTIRAMDEFIKHNPTAHIVVDHTLLARRPRLRRAVRRWRRDTIRLDII